MLLLKKHPQFIYVLFLIVSCIAVPYVAMAGGVGENSPPLSDTKNEHFYISGTIMQTGIECPELKGDDGISYSLIGDVGELSPGMRVRVWGERVKMSFCMRGTPLAVKGIKSLQK